MHPITDTINPHQRLTGWLSITLGDWLAAVPAIVKQLPADQHLDFLVRLHTGLQAAGVDMSEHWDCLIEALIYERQLAGEG